MTRLSWNEFVPRYDSGVDQGVLYLTEGALPWNGLVRVEEKDTTELQSNYYDGRSFRTTQTRGTFQAQIEALSCPKEFESYAGLDGYLDQQGKKLFGLSYRNGDETQRQIHMVWNARVKLSAKNFQSRSAGGPAPEAFIWDLNAKPARIPGTGTGAHIVVDFNDVRYPEAWDELEKLLYGTASTDPRLPTPEEVIELFEAYVIFRVTHHEDGTWTAEGPDEWITVNEDGTYEISSPSVYQIDEYTYSLSSY